MIQNSLHINRVTDTESTHNHTTTAVCFTQTLKHPRSRHDANGQHGVEQSRVVIYSTRLHAPKTHHQPLKHTHTLKRFLTLVVGHVVDSDGRPQQSADTNQDDSDGE